MLPPKIGGSPSLPVHGNPTAVTRKTKMVAASSASTMSLGRSVATALSPGGRLSSESLAANCNSKSRNDIATPPEVYIPLPTKVSSDALCPTAGLKHVRSSSEYLHITPLGYIFPNNASKSNFPNQHKESRHHNNERRPSLRSSVSSPNLHQRNPLSPIDFVPNVPPMPALMSGGLRSPGRILGEMQDVKIRKKRGGLGDLFRL